MVVFLNIALLPLACAVPVAIAIPFTGVLVRFRANYTPRRVQLDDAESDVISEYSFWKYTYFSVGKHVYEIEGISGFFKGFGLAYLAALAITLPVVFVVAGFSATPGMIWRPSHGILGALVSLAFSLGIGIPLKAMLYRSIVTPHKLSFIQPRAAFHILTTPGFYPRGMIQATILVHIVNGLIKFPLAWLFLGWSTALPYPLSTLPVALYYISSIMCSLVLTPLEVLITRLAVQGSHSVDASGLAVETAESIVRLRDEQVEEKCEGLVDCMQKIRDEEGWPVLYRGWWVSFLAFSYLAVF